MGGNGSFVWYRQRKLYRLSENTLLTFSENSIDFLEKLYRLSSDTSVQTLGQHGKNDLIVWVQHSGSFV